MFRPDGTWTAFSSPEGCAEDFHTAAANFPKADLWITSGLRQSGS